LEDDVASHVGFACIDAAPKLPSFLAMSPSIQKFAWQWDRQILPDHQRRDVYVAFNNHKEIDKGVFFNKKTINSTSPYVSIRAGALHNIPLPSRKSQS
jgi:hypothetical protein